MTPPLVTPLVDERASIEEALTRIVDSIGEQNEQMSLRRSELEKAVHLERECLREEISRNRPEISRSEKRLKERTDEHLAKNLSRLTREAEQRETRLRDDMEKLKSQQQQTLGTLGTRIDALMERRTQAMMDRLEGLLGNRSGSRNREANSVEPNREPRVNFNEQPNRRRTSTRCRCSSSSYTTELKSQGAQKSEEGLMATDRPQTKDRCKAQMRLRDLIPQTGVMRIKEEIIPANRTGGKQELLSEVNDAQARHSRDATSMTTAFEPLNRSLETFLTIWDQKTQREVQKGI